MNQILDAGTLAQLAIDQIEENDIVNLLNGMYEQMPCESKDNRDYDRLFAANRLSKANKVLVDKFKKTVFELMKDPKGTESKTVVLGTRMFKLYYTTSGHFERVHLPELTEEQLSKMTKKQIEAEGYKRNLLDEYHELYREIEALEEQMNPKKLRLKGLSDALAAMMPDSKAIKRTPVLQVL